jgi:hypothetical protein
MHRFPSTRRGALLILPTGLLSHNGRWVIDRLISETGPVKITGQVSSGSIALAVAPAVITLTAAEPDTAFTFRHFADLRNYFWVGAFFFNFSLDMIRIMRYIISNKSTGGTEHENAKHT